MFDYLRMSVVGLKDVFHGEDTWYWSYLKARVTFEINNRTVSKFVVQNLTFLLEFSELIENVCGLLERFISWWRYLVLNVSRKNFD